MSDEELTAIDQRCTDATTGPWHGIQSRNGRGDPIWRILSGHTDETSVVVDADACVACSGGVHSRADTLFIVHARRDIPRLLAYIRELKGGIA